MSVNGIKLLSLLVPRGFGKFMKRGDALILLTDLTLKEKLVKPSLVCMEQRKPARFQLKIKGDFDIEQVEILLKNRGLNYTQLEGYLIIFKP